MPGHSIERVNYLAEALLLKATHVRLPWRRFEGEANAFILPGQAGSVVVASSRETGEHPYRFLLLDPEGRVVEEAQTLEGEVYYPWEVRVASLYDVARASALGVDDVLEGFAREFDLPAVDVPAMPDDDF